MQLTTIILATLAGFAAASPTIMTRGHDGHDEGKGKDKGDEMPMPPGGPQMPPGGSMPPGAPMPPGGSYPPGAPMPPSGSYPPGAPMPPGGSMPPSYPPGGHPMPPFEPPFTMPEDLCPGNRSPLCCQLDLDQILDSTCETPDDDPKTKEEFAAVCSAAGATAECCVLPILGDGLLCNTP